MSIPKIIWRAWFIWFIAGLFYLYEFIHRVSPSVMVPDLMQDFAVSAATLGILSSCYFYSYALLQIPAGFMLDMWGPRRLLLFASLLLALSSFVFAKTNALFTASMSRLLIGAASAFSFIGCLKLCTTWFPSKRFPLLVGLTNVLGVVGAILGGHPLAVAVDHYGWRTTLAGSGYLSLLLALGMYFLVYDSPFSTMSLGIPKEQKAATKAAFAAIKQPRIWLTAIYGCFMVAPIAAFSELWGVPYLMTQYALNKPSAALLMSTTFLGIAVGGPVFGWVSGQLSRMRPLMLLGTVGAGITLSTLIYYPHLSYASLSILQFSFGAFTSIMLLCFSLNCKGVPSKGQGVVIGFTNTVVMCGSVLFQPLIGKILDYRGHFSVEDYHRAFILFPLCHLSALAVLYFIKERHTEPMI